MLLQCFLLVTTPLILSATEYWSSEFNLEATCEDKDVIAKLSAGQCAKASEKGNLAAFQKCKTTLESKLFQSCGDYSVKNAGELVYCRVEGVLQCCFKNHSCTSTTTNTNSNTINTTFSVTNTTTTNTTSTTPSTTSTTTNTTSTTTNTTTTSTTSTTTNTTSTTTSITSTTTNTTSTTTNTTSTTTNTIFTPTTRNKTTIQNTTTHKTLAYRSETALAVEFLKNTEKVLVGIAAEGYKACHKIAGYDASVCAADCEREGVGLFAQRCTITGGFFKCCIRRDKVHCDECRFCCSLPVCSYKEGGDVIFRAPRNLDRKEGRNSAIEKMNTPGSMFNGQDHRCLKPDKTKDPSQWPFYNQVQFRQAMDKQELNKVEVVEFDVNLLNFEDPKVLAAFIGQDYKKYWKKTYGFDWIKKTPFNIEYHVAGETVYERDLTREMKQCLRTELQDKFGRDCKKKKGVYKCCTSGFDLSVYDETRVALNELGLLKKPYTGICGKEKNKDRKCHFSVVTHLCTTQDKLTHTAVTEFLTPSKPEFQMGGNPVEDPKWRGLRTKRCTFLNTCQGRNILEMDVNLYEKAVDKAGVCKSALNAKAPIQNESQNLSQTFMQNVQENCEAKKLQSLYLCGPKHIEDANANRLANKIHNFLKKVIKRRKVGKRKKNKHKKIKSEHKKKASKKTEIEKKIPEKKNKQKEKNCMEKENKKVITMIHLLKQEYKISKIKQVKKRRKKGRGKRKKGQKKKRKKWKGRDYFNIKRLAMNVTHHEMFGEE